MKLETLKVVDLGKSLWRDITLTKGNMDEFSEWDSPREILDNLKDLTELCGRAMLCVEQAVRETGITLGSKDKRESAAEILDAMVPLPGMLEFVDGPAFEYALGFIASFWNEKVGHTWPTE